jgi:hypothetical protein
VRISRLMLYDMAFRLLDEYPEIDHIELSPDMSSQYLDIYAKGDQIWTAGDPDVTDRVHKSLVQALSRLGITGPNDARFLGL